MSLWNTIGKSNKRSNSQSVTVNRPEPIVAPSPMIYSAGPPNVSDVNIPSSQIDLHMQPVEPPDQLDLGSPAIKIEEKRSRRGQARQSFTTLVSRLRQHASGTGGGSDNIATDSKPRIVLDNPNTLPVRSEHTASLEDIRIIPPELRGVDPGDASNTGSPLSARHQSETSRPGGMTELGNGMHYYEGCACHGITGGKLYFPSLIAFGAVTGDEFEMRSD